MIEFVVAIGEDEEMVVHKWDAFGSFPCQSVGWVRGAHVSVGLISVVARPSIPLHVKLTFNFVHQSGRTILSLTSVFVSCLGLSSLEVAACRLPSSQATSVIASMQGNLGWNPTSSSEAEEEREFYEGSEGGTPRGNHFL